MNIGNSFGPSCVLGEGPLWHPLRKQLFWFDIPIGRLYRSNELGDQIQHWDLGEPASAAGWVDQDRLLIATASGLQNFNIESGCWKTVCLLEENNSQTRTNDGRTGPDGSFWLGTMSHSMVPRAGAYYRISNSSCSVLIENVSIPNATCFSPDGKTAYLADTRKQLIWRWPLDKDGNPIGEREIHINLRDDNLNPDGAVCDAEGFLWNAQWGASRICRYAPDGSLDKIVELPVSQPTCPAFGGEDLKTLFITSASQGLSEEQLAKQLHAGKVIAIESDIPGIKEHQIKL